MRVIFYYILNNLMYLINIVYIFCYGSFCALTLKQNAFFYVKNH